MLRLAGTPGVGPFGRNSTPSIASQPSRHIPVAASASQPLLFPRELGDKCRRPGLTPVIRIKFLKMVGIRGDIGPNTPNQDRAPVDGVLSEKLAAAVLERADQRGRQHAALAVGKRLTPLTCLRVVEEQGRSLPMTIGAVGLNLFQLSAPAPDLAYRYSTYELVRVRRAGKWVQNARDFRPPH